MAYQYGAGQGGVWGPGRIDPNAPNYRPPSALRDFSVGQGKRSMMELLGEANQFDPTEYTNRAAQGSFNTFRDQLNLDMEALRGQQVGMGRLNTGFATQDEDRMTYRGMQSLNDILAQNAMTAGRMKQDQFNIRGDLISGMHDRAQAEKNAKAHQRGSLLGGALSLAGLGLAPALGLGKDLFGRIAGANIFGAWGSAIGGRS